MDSVLICLNELKKKGFNPKTILDIGANKGSWTESVKSIFSDSNFFMFEADEKHYNSLNKLKNSKVDFEICLLSSNKEDNVKFYTLKDNIGDGLNTGASIFKEKTKIYQDDNNILIKEMTTHMLDDIVKIKNIKNIDFIKLDVQGSELLVLEGGKETLNQAEFCLLEVHMQLWNNNAPLVHDIVEYMKKNNFILYDICSLARVDGFLINSDFLFKKNNNNYQIIF